MDRPSASATACGLAAIGLWSTTVGGSRVLTEALGPVTTGACVYSIAGVLGCLGFYRSREARRRFGRLPRPYLLVCGGLFVIYTVCLYAAIGLASGRRQVLEVGLINYLWPALTLVFSIGLLGRRPKRGFALGVGLAVAGAVAATWPAGGLDPAAFAANVRSNAWPYLLATTAAVIWALYSNLVRRWAAASTGAGIPAFVLAAGLVMAALRPAVSEAPAPTPAVVGWLAFMAVGPSLTGYVLWDVAMRRGNMTLVASAAHLIPVLSTVAGCAVLGVLPGVNFWFGCAAVVVGAVLCKARLR